MAGASDDEARPLEIDLQRTRQLHIRWSDGHESTYPLILLRRNCPCATCRARREEQSGNRLVVLAGPTDERDAVVVESAELAGNYALRIRWKDGHDTGIYDYRTLRALCPCPACRDAGRRD